jgi:hypothetical protein
MVAGIPKRRKRKPRILIGILLELQTLIVSEFPLEGNKCLARSLVLAGIVNSQAL